MKRLFIYMLLITFWVGLSGKALAEWAATIRMYPSSAVLSLIQTNDGGYIVLGEHSYYSEWKQNFWVIKLKANSAIEWQKTYGLLDQYGNQLDDVPHVIEQTSDGGYILTGNSDRRRTWIIKLDNSGDIEWQKISDYFSFYNGKIGTDVKETSDGGFIIADQPSKYGASDFGLMKLAPNGDFLWRAIYGYNDWQMIKSVQVTEDGGYIISGDEGYSTDRHFWIVKTNPNGSIQWQKKYRGGEPFKGESWPTIRTTSDGGFIVGGITNSFGANGADGWILKLFPDGNIDWQKRYYTITGTHEYIYDLKQTHDGGYVFAGVTDDYSGPRSKKIWVVKLDQGGSIIWDKVYYGGGMSSYSIDQTTDSGYVLGGSKRYPSDVYEDFFIIKINENGDIKDCSLLKEEGVTFAAEADGTAIDTHYYHQIITSPSIIDTDATAIITNGTINYVCQISNNPPIANSGEDIIITSREISSTIINGSATDPDPGDQLMYRWLEESTVIQDWLSTTTGGECPLALSSVNLNLGTHILRLEVSDGEAESYDNMKLVIGNTAPFIALSGGGIYEINSNVPLGCNISDYDGDQITYEWRENSTVLCSGSIQSIAGGSPVSLEACNVDYLNMGVHEIILEVFDGTNTVTDNIEVEIVDTSVPKLAPTINSNLLWPPNHKMVDIEIQANAIDNSGGSIFLSAEIKSNEPEEGLGDADIFPDWTAIEINQDTGIIKLQLRAERSGQGNGREYIITISAMDTSNNSVSTDLKVIVPHDMRDQ